MVLPLRALLLVSNQPLCIAPTMAADSNAGTGAQPHDDTRLPFTSFSLSLSLCAPAAPTLACIPSTIHLPTQISTLAVCTLVWFRADLRLHDHEPLHATVGASSCNLPFLALAQVLQDLLSETLEVLREAV
jgi:hypothetical protein